MSAQVDAVMRAVSHVMTWPLDGLAPSTPFATLGVDSIALVVIADVLEAENAGWIVTTDMLKTARSIQELADVIIVGEPK
ncbi:MAG: hypothetical protein RLZZ426_873 [Actinomycetota bacterium]